MHTIEHTIDHDDDLLDFGTSNSQCADVPDIRTKQLSYSALTTFHSCPRKFQLDRLKATSEQTESPEGSLTFAYGHAIGDGIQQLLRGVSIQEVMFTQFINWRHEDLLFENPKQNKSFFGAMVALQQMASLLQTNYLDEWELVYYEGKPACELSFIIHLPNEYKYRGFVDAVLKNKYTGEIMVLECKTTSAYSVNPAQYKNSAQAIGYSVVLDKIFPDLSSYKVLYLVYQTKSEEYVQIPFTKSHYARALWLRELLLDVDVLELYENCGIYPTRGESCFAFMRECKYLGTCHLPTERLATAYLQSHHDEIIKSHTDFQISVSIEDLIEAQLTKETE